jgi:hypothetical protein
MKFYRTILELRRIVSSERCQWVAKTRFSFLIYSPAGPTLVYSLKGIPKISAAVLGGR